MRLKDKLTFGERQGLTCFFAMQAAEEYSGIKNRNDLNRLEQIKDELPPSVEKYFFYIMGADLAWDYDIDQAQEYLQKLENEYPEHYPLVKKGYYSELYHHERWGLGNVEDPLRFPDLTPEEKSLIYRSIGKRKARRWNALDISVEEIRNNIMLEVDDVPEKYEESWVTGVGITLLSKWKKDPISLKEKIRQVEAFPMQLKGNLLKGVGISLAMNHDISLADFMQAEVYPELEEESVNLILEGKNDFWQSLGFQAPSVKAMLKK